MLTNLPVPYDLCVVSKFHVYLLGLNAHLNMKALVGIFNQEKAVVGAVGAFPVIVKSSQRFV